MIPMWVSFRVSISDLLASYNSTEVGKLSPARLEKTTGENFLVISRQGGISPDNRSLSITVRMSLRQEIYTIEVIAEEWITGTTSKTRAFNPLQLIFDGNLDSGDTWLQLKEHEKVRKLDPFHAAEYILQMVLLTEPEPLEYTEVVMMDEVHISSI